MLKQFSAAKKLSSKSVPEMAGFRKFKGINIKCCYRDPQKAEQLFTCKLGGRIPTHSGISPTRSSHFAKMG